MRLFKIVALLLSLALFPVPASAQEDSPANPEGEAYWQKSIAAYEAADYQGALNLARQGCDVGFYRACFGAGRLFVGSELDYQDETLALPYFREACKGNIVEACTWMGSTYWLGKKVANNDKLARLYYRKACLLGDEKDACGYAAFFQREGKGDEPDLPGARVNFGKSCAAGSYLSCTSYAIMVENGDGGDAKPELARSVYTEVCEKAHLDDLPQQSCLNLARMALAGEGGPVDTEMVLMGYQSACGWDDGEGCELFGNWITRPEVIAENKGLYSDWRSDLNYECTQDGTAEACTAVAKLYELGLGGDKDPATADFTYKIACGMGDPKACKD